MNSIERGRGVFKTLPNIYEEIFPKIVNYNSQKNFILDV